MLSAMGMPAEVKWLSGCSARGVDRSIPKVLARIGRLLVLV